MASQEESEDIPMPPDMFLMASLSFAFAKQLRAYSLVFIGYTETKIEPDRSNFGAVDPQDGGNVSGRNASF